MKQSSSSSTHFGGIPLDTNTLAGQWLTFSHMANHYRKLLNVKPRVDTGLLGSGTSGGTGNFRGSYHNLSTNSKMLQSSKPGKKKKNSTNSCNNNNASSSIYNHHGHDRYHHRNRESLIYSSHPDHLDICSSSSNKNKPVTSSPANDNIALTIKSPLKNGRSKKKALTSHFPEYQVVFGPSSIRSSSDGAFLSDDTASTVSNENNKPPSDVQTPIGVTEKIRRFLNHIHQLDLTTTTTSSSKPSKKSKIKVATAPLTPTGSSIVTAEKPVNSAGTIVTTNNRESRHSKCFLPYEPPSPKSPRKCVSSSMTTGESARNNQLSSRNKKYLDIVDDDHHHHHHRQFAKSAHYFHHPQQLHKSPKLARNKFTGSGGDIQTMIPEKDTSGSGKRPKTRRRAESVASIGTIFGSEDLAAEDYPVTIKDIYSTLQRGLGDEDLLLQRIMDDNLHSMKNTKKSQKKVLHEQDRNSRRENRPFSSSMIKSSSMASIPSSSADGASVGGTSTFAKSHRHHGAVNTTTSAGGVHAHANNKDSSRDSAYGFSSGESRITTRESTPEKKCSSDGLHLGTNKSHVVDFVDMKPCKDVQTSLEKLSTRIDKRYNKSKVNQSTRSTSTNDLRRRDSNERYITFLTDLTQDIVRKEIYTNKGLKTLLKSHLEQNKELNPNKLSDMVERLRMDLGIPKDDSLDKMEFGYGSVSEVSTTTYFYAPSAPSHHDKMSTESILLSAKTAVSSSLSSGVVMMTPSEVIDPPSNPSSYQSSPSPTTIIPTAVITQVVGTAMTSSTTGFSSSGGEPNSSSNRSSTTGTAEEGSGAGDFNSVLDESEDNFITAGGKHHHLDEEEEEDEGNVHNDDELSLSETEVSQYLKVAGLDAGTMQSVMGILKS